MQQLVFTRSFISKWTSKMKAVDQPSPTIPEPLIVTADPHELRVCTDTSFKQGQCIFCIHQWLPTHGLRTTGDLWGRKKWSTRAQEKKRLPSISSNISWASTPPWTSREGGEQTAYSRPWSVNCSCEQSILCPLWWFVGKHSLWRYQREQRTHRPQP